MVQNEETLGLALTNHALTVGLFRLLRAKGTLTQAECDEVIHDSLTVLETAVPDRTAVRSARLILEEMIGPRAARACRLPVRG